ncbi:MAG: hypothetical protein EOO43_07430 [Flavobacterium sp.]|nr:MAG: hypothetical protein EOO43_07430 [Flavobacterium sp.]
MKRILFLLMTLVTLTSSGQEKYNFKQFNTLKEVEGTNYVIATLENWSKIGGVKNRYLLFVETKTGQTKQVDIGTEGYFERIEQVKIDDLGINRIIVSARAIDLAGKQGIDWNDPRQIIILSTDGKERIQLTDNELFVQTWLVNRTAATITIIGHYDVNNNGKVDKTDKGGIFIYDLKTLKLVSKL